DGKLVSLEYKLQTGEIVEILTSTDPYHGPNRAWLDIAKTNESRSKIRSWFKKERREENIEHGREELEKEFKRNGINVPPEDLPDFLGDDMKRHNCATLDDFYAAIGYGGIILSKIIQRLKDLYTRKYGSPAQPKLSPLPPRLSNTGIVVGGESNIDVKMSKCCSPLPGEDIIGFITKGHGVSIHRTDCEKYRHALETGEDADRWVDVTWAENAKTNDNPIFKATVDIVAHSNITLIADVCAITADMRVPVTNISSKILKNGNANLILTCSIAGVEQLRLLISKIKKLPDVMSADRVMK
ncbi:MAG: bifunctional (p)ppGpp synthetase/guanosine-3',5'-bis(diphosphate) 3'-pyrophosphohydrolase, partial [Oscillospiraceae bacterium]|nr:bifunctional (p)ppGpp synthetase/guanosine-3',5'-bis(diphosphate) 3'-pyrophosphohydrolase [Oscillospiraceae bacterium]